jgi:hypothetical protein
VIYFRLSLNDTEGVTVPDPIRDLLAALTAERYQPISPPLPVKVRPARPWEIADALDAARPRLAVVSEAGAA